MVENHWMLLEWKIEGYVMKLLDRLKSKFGIKCIEIWMFGFYLKFLFWKN